VAKRPYHSELQAPPGQSCPFENCEAGEEALKDIIRQYNRTSFGKPSGNKLSVHT